MLIWGCASFPAIFWILAVIGPAGGAQPFWQVAFGNWLLAIGFWQLVFGNWFLAPFPSGTASRVRNGTFTMRRRSPREQPRSDDSVASRGMDICQVDFADPVGSCRANGHFFLDVFVKSLMTKLQNKRSPNACERAHPPIPAAVSAFRPKTPPHPLKNHEKTQLQLVTRADS